MQRAKEDPRFDGVENVKVREVVRPGRTALVEQLVADMGRDGLNWTKGWVGPGGGVRNPLSGTRYHGFNALRLIHAMRVLGTDDPRFVTMRQANLAHMSVEPGATPFYIERWKSDKFIVSRSTGKPLRPQPRGRDAWARALRDPDNEVRHTRSRLVSYFTVYNASQVKGMEPLVPTQEEPLRGEGLVDFLEGFSPVPVLETAGDDAYYSPAEDRIVVPGRRQFHDVGNLARTLLHEQVHSTGAPSRLDRQIMNRFASEGYAFEELVAEIGAVLTANEIGCGFPDIGDDAADGHPAYWDSHVAYIRSWATMAPGDDLVQAVMTASNRAGMACDWLMGNCFAEPLEAVREGREPCLGADERDNPSLGQAAASVTHDNPRPDPVPARAEREPLEH